MIPEPIRALFAPDRWPAFVLVSTRLVGLMITAPVWSMTMVPQRVRAAITVLLTLLLLPAAPRVAWSAGVLDLPLPLACELVIGILIGLTAAVIVQGAALAGEVVSMQMGLSLTQALSPQPESPVSGVGQLQTYLALLIYLGLGGHLMLLAGLERSLRVLPPGTILDFENLGRVGARLFGTLFTSALCIAAPVMATLLLVSLAVALLSRAVPQMNTMMVSLPASIAVGLLMVGMALPFIAGSIEIWMRGLPGAVDQVVNSLHAVPAGP
jgi:flagellar biosynthetic protein FliR